MALIAWP